ncbi:hypothetical protein C8F04DRAFT_1252579 [Mycena alexandri]|uniref:F-box domain-containing protein n=1 Tax=Mycena alexandri TaxID=1745969 RepID=A0AAD6XEA5_9AGAR|nr:hypothetical protein C8F04DRAFT_1252579 [Mycena alexandri]
MPRRPILLLDLPPEILILIFYHLDLPTLTACLATNRRVKSIIDGSTLLQYRLAAQAACVEDNPWNTKVDSAHKLLALQRREAAFTELVPTSICSVELDDIDLDACRYALSGGVFAMMALDTRVLRWLSLATTEPVFQQLEFPGYLQDLALAIPEDDLLVVVLSPDPLEGQLAFEVAVELRFYEMSTQSAHRMARDHVIPVSISGASSPVFEIETFGPNVFLLVDYFDSAEDTEVAADLRHLFIYDWKLGCLLKSFDNYSTAIFLSPDVILLAQMVSGTFELWAISEGTVSGPDISLKLPALTKPGKYEILAIESNPKGYVSSQEPFRPSFDDSSVGFDIVLQFEDESVEDLLLVISRRALLQLLPAAEERGKVLLWRDWGPPISHWPDNPDGPLSDWPTTICGHRCALVGPAGHIRLADFNPYSYKKFLQAERDDPGVGLTTAVVSVRDKDRLIGAGLFGEEVRANLGYLVIESWTTRHLYIGIFVGENSIAGLKKPVVPGCLHTATLLTGK